MKDDDIVMFNPMGMGVFDIAVAAYYYNKSIEMGVGIDLAD
jgi:ornithine cyclodeaminase